MLTGMFYFYLKPTVSVLNLSDWSSAYHDSNWGPLV